MSLIKCKDCGTEISKNAKQCPKCGAPIKKKGGCGTLLLVSFIGVLLLGGISSLFVDRDNSPSPPQAPSAAPTSQVQPESFDFSSVKASELPAETELREPVEFAIAGGKGKTVAPAGAKVQVRGHSGSNVEVAFLDGRQVVPYTKTTIEPQIRALRQKQQQEEQIRLAGQAEEKAQRKKAEKEAKKNRKITLYASRNSNGTISVQNLDKFDWTSVRLYLNSKYETEVSVIKAGSSVNIPSTEFTLKDGTRFNPFATKATLLVVTADTPLGRTPSEVHWK